MDALNFLRELLCSILSSWLFLMLVALTLKVRWPEAVLKGGLALASKAIVYSTALLKPLTRMDKPRTVGHL